MLQNCSQVLGNDDTRSTNAVVEDVLSSDAQHAAVAFRLDDDTRESEQHNCCHESLGIQLDFGSLSICKMLSLVAGSAQHAYLMHCSNISCCCEFLGAALGMVLY